MSSFHLIALLTLLVGAVGAIATVAAVPEVRCRLGLDDPVYEILRDDFSNPASGWPDNLNQQTVNSGDFAGYLDGSYHMASPPRSTDRSLFPRTLIASDLSMDMSIEVDTTTVGTPPKDYGNWGVVCRSNNPENPEDANYYSMGITNTGGAYIVKVRDGREIILYEEPLPDNTADTSETNSIRGDCVGNALILHVNNERIKKVYDTEISRGHFGLLTRNPSDQQGESVEVSFDNFEATVYAPTDAAEHCLPK